jgi:hypothetical protein
MKFRNIESTGIERNNDANGSRTYTSIFLNEKDEQFMIDIRSESYKRQSYAKLFKWSQQQGWLIITTKNPHFHYNVDISFSNDFEQTVFDPIIKDLKEIAGFF